MSHVNPGWSRISCIWGVVPQEESVDPALVRHPIIFSWLHPDWLVFGVTSGERWMSLNFSPPPSLSLCVNCGDLCELGRYNSSFCEVVLLEWVFRLAKCQSKHTSLVQLMQTDHTEANKSFKEAIKLPLDKWMLMLSVMALELWRNLRLNWFFKRCHWYHSKKCTGHDEKAYLGGWYLWACTVWCSF